MNKTLLAVCFLIAFAGLQANAQDAARRNAAERQKVAVKTTSPDIRPGFRFDIEVGAATLLATSDDPEMDISPVGVHAGFFTGHVFNLPSHALGFAFDYRYNQYKYQQNSAWILGDNDKGYFHTFYAGPQYSFLSSPRSKVSFIADLSFGYVYTVERYYKKNSSFGAFGARLGVGFSFAAKNNSYYYLKASVFGVDGAISRVDDLNISSVNLSLGVAIGR